MEQDEILQQMRAETFIENNGVVLRMINFVARHDFVALKKVRNCMVSEMPENEFVDSVDFLSKAGYIELYTFTSDDNRVRFAGRNYRELRTLISEKGIRLLRGEYEDKSVKV